MSEAKFSNADTGSKPADPYTSKNVDSTSLKERVEDFSKFISQAKFGMLTTHNKSSDLLVARAMGLAAKEGGGVDLIFHTNTESGKTDDLQSDSAVNVSFLNSTGEWASVSGHATVITDRSVVKKYYSPALKGWLGDLGDGTHDGGPEDPRIGIIKVKSTTIHYAIANLGVIGRNVEFVKGVVTGEAPAVNKLRELTPQELDEWRQSHPDQ